MTKTHFVTNNMKALQRRHSTATVIGVILVVQLLFCSVVSASAQSEVSFTSEDRFEIPSKNSSIRFAVNGTYKSATLVEGVWTFQNLYMPNSRATEKLNLTISATDCDVTVYPYLSAPYTYGVARLRWVILPYSVSGHGTQVINLGFDPDKGQLDVILDGEFAARNQHWKRSSDGTLTITGAHSNVTLWYIKHPEQPEDASYVSEHYVLIGSTGFLSVILVLAVAVKYRTKDGADQ